MKNKITYFLMVMMSSVLFSCNDLDVAPYNIIQDKDVFGSTGGVTAYMSALYQRLPIEDFRYSAQNGFNNHDIRRALFKNTGEAIQNGSPGITNPATGYWGDAYTCIRYINYLIKVLPENSAGLSSGEIESYLGEACFLRAYVYFALVKRYGGVPIIKEVQSFPEQSLEELQVPRNTESEVYDFIAEDLDVAISKLPDKSIQRGRANKYVAAALKSRAMLFAGSIAKYGQMNASCPAVGIPAGSANKYLKSSYDAAKLLEGVYSLYRKNSDKYQNYVDLFFDATSSENIFVKEYHFPETGHCYDAMFIPHQWVGPQGYGSQCCPTLDYVELFDGLPRNASGHILTKDATNTCIYYNDRMELFQNAEPRLRATVILPGDVFKNQVADIKRGTYVGSISAGIKYTDDLTTNPFLNNNLTARATNAVNNTYTFPAGSLHPGVKIVPCGLSGPFNGNGIGGTISGFGIRKYLDPNKPTDQVRLPNYSTQSWIDIRYAEVLLNRAEAAYELYQNGYTGEGIDYQQDAFVCINDIRDRAGAILLPSQSALNDIQIIRKERRKELAFENKLWWDMRRWRTAHSELNNRLMYVLFPYYVYENDKWVYQRRPDEKGNAARLTFNVNWYYEAIPAGEITKNPNLLPNNPGY